MSNIPLRIGLVGCGWAGGQAALAATAVPRTEVTAVSDLVDDLREKVAEECSVPNQYTDYQNLLADDTVDAVYLAVNPVMRYQMVLDAFAAGKHVLVQKPHAVRAEQIIDIEAAADKAGKTLQFCYFMRHFPKNRQIRAAVQSGKIGTPYHARVFLKYNFRPPAEGITRWLQVYGQKGGALGQHASHEFDLAWWWLGCPKPAWAFATKHSIYPVYDGPEGPAEDYFTGQIGFDTGQTIQIDCSRWLHSDTPTTLELYGSEGAITAGVLSRFDGEAYVTEEIGDPNPTGLPVFYHEIEHFARAVAGEVEPDVNANDAYWFMKILDGMYDSAAIGEKVVIDGLTD